jgi:hypothetical protein
MHAVDISNYTTALTAERLASWKTDHDIGLVIVQSLNQADFPQSDTAGQVALCQEAGLPVDIYVYPFFANGPNDAARRLRGVVGLSVRRVWLDVEDVDGSSEAWSAEQRANAVARWLVDCDAFPTTGTSPAGIYTGQWYWNSYMRGITRFASRSLWDADYDGVDNVAYGWEPYGGWVERAVKQYRGTTTLDGVGNVDLSVLSDEEASQVETPSTPDCSGLINGLAYVADDLGDQLLAEAQRSNVRKTVVRAIVKEMQRVRLEQIGPRP